MCEPKQQAENSSPLRERPLKEYWIPFLLLFIVCLIGILGIWLGENGHVFLFAISGFSIAYSIHFFSISLGITGALFRVAKEAPDAINQLREVEYEIVGCGLKVLSGGLGVLLSGGILLVINSNQCPMWWRLLPTVAYLLASIYLVWNVGLYQLAGDPESLRGWPTKTLRILKDR